MHHGQPAVLLEPEPEERPLGPVGPNWFGSVFCLRTYEWDRRPWDQQPVQKPNTHCSALILCIWVKTQNPLLCTHSLHTSFKGFREGRRMHTSFKGFIGGRRMHTSFKGFIEGRRMHTSFKGFIKKKKKKKKKKKATTTTSTFFKRQQASRLYLCSQLSTFEWERVLSFFFI